MKRIACRTRATGMYRTVIAALRQFEPALRVCRLYGHALSTRRGRLDEGDGKIFDDIVYEYDIGDGIRDGWLAPLSSKALPPRSTCPA